MEGTCSLLSITTYQRSILSWEDGLDSAGHWHYQSSSSSYEKKRAPLPCSCSCVNFFGTLQAQNTWCVIDVGLMMIIESSVLPLLSNEPAIISSLNWTIAAYLFFYFGLFPSDITDVYAPTSAAFWSDHRSWLKGSVRAGGSESTQGFTERVSRTLPFFLAEVQLCRLIPCVPYSVRTPHASVAIKMIIERRLAWPTSKRQLDHQYVSTAMRISVLCLFLCIPLDQSRKHHCIPWGGAFWFTRKVWWWSKGGDMTREQRGIIICWALGKKCVD